MNRLISALLAGGLFAVCLGFAAPAWAADGCSGLIEVPVSRVAEIPAVVREPLGEIAEPGAPFEATDVVSGDLPNTRLFSAGHNGGNLYFVIYEQGGAARFFALRIFIVLSDDGGRTGEASQMLALGANSPDAACDAARYLLEHDVFLVGD